MNEKAKQLKALISQYRTVFDERSANVGKRTAMAHETRMLEDRYRELEADSARIYEEIQTQLVRCGLQKIPNVVQFNDAMRVLEALYNEDS